MPEENVNVRIQKSIELKGSINEEYLRRQKLSHILKAIRSSTLANILVPFLCIPLFQNEVNSIDLMLWLALMGVAVAYRSFIAFKMEYREELITNAKQGLERVALTVGFIGCGWAVGWLVIAPQLGMINHMIYIYGTTAAMISSMFAYSCDKKIFYAFTLPIMLSSLFTVTWRSDSFPWPFSVGLVSLYLIVIGIAKNFANIFEKSVSLGFRNEELYKALAHERDISNAANIAKSKFIATASHDLRQPMYAINLYLDSIDYKEIPIVLKDKLSKISKSANTLNVMFESLLTISKLDAQKYETVENWIDMRSVMDSIHVLFESQTAKKGLTFNLATPDIKIFANKSILTQIISNLISNAIQYTEAGSIHVFIEDVAGSLAIRVQDTGSGIPKIEQEKIFEEFYRSSATRDKHDGLGLGLTIVKRLCSHIGASIEVSSTPGKGATFIIKTNYKILETDKGSAATNTALQLENKNHWLLHGKNIAVIEDDPTLIDAYCEVITQWGGVPCVLSESMELLENELLSLDEIHCILCDYRLRNTTGDLIIEKIRDSFNKKIPAIIVTADTAPQQIELFSKLNISVLHKPINFQEILVLMERLLKTKLS
jgi:signal transduction histidine kinase/CheY-like chemotaxis protein